MAKSPKTFWGGVGMIASAIPALGAGVVHGVSNEITGKGSFGEGFEHTSDIVMDACTDFGDEHAKQLTGVAISTAGAIVTNKINTDYNNRHKQK